MKCLNETLDQKNESYEFLCACEMSSGQSKACRSPRIRRRKEKKKSWEIFVVKSLFYFCCFLPFSWLFPWNLVYILCLRCLKEGKQWSNVAGSQWISLEKKRKTQQSCSVQSGWIWRLTFKIALLVLKIFYLLNLTPPLVQLVLYIDPSAQLLSFQLSPKLRLVNFLFNSFFHLSCSCCNLFYLLF